MRGVITRKARFVLRNGMRDLSAFSVKAKARRGSEITASCVRPLSKCSPIFLRSKVNLLGGHLVSNTLRNFIDLFYLNEVALVIILYVIFFLSLVEKLNFNFFYW